MCISGSVPAGVAVMIAPGLNEYWVSPTRESARYTGSCAPSASRRPGLALFRGPQRRVSAFGQVGHERAQPVEALAHGEPLERAVRDPLEDDRDLVEGEAEVP